MQLTTSPKPIPSLAVEVGIVAKAVAASITEPQIGAKAPIRLKKLRGQQYGLGTIGSEIS